MKKIELIKAYVEGDTIHYQVREDAGLGLLKKEVVDLFIRYHGDRNYDCDLSKDPYSILLTPIFLYMLPITYFFNDVELVMPEMDKVLYEQLPTIYEAYSKIYGPFKKDWRGKVTVQKVVENTPVENAKYDKVVFFSGGVDACHAGINNPGKKSLLVSIPDIERDAVSEGPLREEKYSLVKNFAEVVDSDWLLISNNFNTALFNEKVIYNCLSFEVGLCSDAYKYDGWGGIRYLANMCCVAPVAYLTSIKLLVMGSTFEQIEDKLLNNYDGASPELSDTIRFCDTIFTEQDALTVRRTQKVLNIINWCKSKNTTTKMWVCFSNSSVQCGFCVKCLRTQLNILCAGENPKEWGFEKFSEKKFSQYVKAYKYNESNPCWMWDNIDTIQDDRIYPYCDELLHWLKSIGYKEYHQRAVKKARPTLVKRLLAFGRYSHYLKVIISKLTGRK